MARLSAILLHIFERDGRNGGFGTLRTIVCGLQTRDVVLSSIRAQKDNAKVVKTIHTLYFAEGRRLIWIALVMRLSDRMRAFLLQVCKACSRSAPQLPSFVGMLRSYWPIQQRYVWKQPRRIANHGTSFWGSYETLCTERQSNVPFW